MRMPSPTLDISISDIRRTETDNQFLLDLYGHVCRHATKTAQEPPEKWDKHASDLPRSRSEWASNGTCLKKPTRPNGGPTMGHTWLLPVKTWEWDLYTRVHAQKSLDLGNLVTSSALYHWSRPTFPGVHIPAGETTAVREFCCHKGVYCLLAKSEYITH